MTHVFTYRVRDGLLIIEVTPISHRPTFRRYRARLTEVQLLAEPSKRADYAGTVEAKYERQYVEMEPEACAIDLIRYVYDAEPEDMA
jgi:hypothetical protein